MLVALARFVPTPSAVFFHEEKKLKARVRLTSHNILEIAIPSRIHRCLKWTSLTPGSIRRVRR